RLARPITTRARELWRRRDAAAYLIVNRVDAGRGADHLLRVAERERQHRPNSRVQPPKAGEQAAAERAVVVHAGRDRGMPKLKQNGPAPADDDDHLAVDFPGDAFGPGAHM